MGRRRTQAGYLSECLLFGIGGAGPERLLWAHCCHGRMWPLADRPLSGRPPSIPAVRSEIRLVSAFDPKRTFEHVALSHHVVFVRVS